MLYAGADRICFVISPWKSDILQYYGARIDGAAIAYVVQPEACGLCDAIFRALPLIRPDESVVVGLPDTIWLPENGLAELPDDKLAFLTFPVARPEFFDAVAADHNGRVQEIQVKTPGASTRWVWGAFRLPVRCCTHYTACGRDASHATNISAHWSMPISPRAARRSRSRPAPIMSMSAHWAAIARRCDC